ncbi:serum amyloid A-5 protein-like [Macrobrachium rosenbergii]|uniref:serum amyloid A-5 protein-like n=1 Tax=Macrobrachium rosenbergii TaxID=79674 RepID=UPI0034D3F04D
MNSLLAVTTVVAVFAVRAEGVADIWDTVTKPLKFGREAVQGAVDMAHAYVDMRRANFKNSDKYFHARGNYDAARRGPGGSWAARVISNARETVDQWRGGNPAASAADQEANRWGRKGGDPNKYRPKGLPTKYRRSVF